MTERTSIGRAERIEVLELKLTNLPAKVDTGADSSSIWVSSVSEKSDGLHCVFFGPGSPHYSGETIVVRRGYSITRVANSFGHKELRYKVKLRIRVKGRLIRATFTLSDRSRKTYPVLLGRRMLQGKFLVDVSQGEPLKAIEQSKSRRLKQDLDQIGKEK